jgi:hypothetical protein
MTEDHDLHEAGLDGDEDEVFEADADQEDWQQQDTSRPKARPAGPVIIDLVNVPTMLCANCEQELDGELCSCCGARASPCQPYVFRFHPYVLFVVPT